MKFTAKEIKFIQAVLKNASNACGAETFQDLIDDNFSYFGVETIVEMTDFSKHQVAGLISALQFSGKNIISEGEDPDGGTDYNYFIFRSFLQDYPSEMKLVDWEG